MNQPVDSSLLENTALTTELTAEECAILAGIAHLRELESGDILFSEGEEDDRLFVIVSGRLAVTRSVGRDRWDTLKLLDPGDMAGESAFIEGGPHSVTLRAVGATTVVGLGRESFEALLDQHPRMVYRVMRSIIHHLREIMHQMNEQHVQMTQYINQAGYGSSYR